MRQRFTGIAAILILVMMMPVSRACAMVSQGAKVQQDCCKSKVLANSCCESPSHLGCAVHATADTTPYPAQSVSALVVPPATVAVIYHDSLNSKSRCLALYLPAQHEPPGLLMAAMTVLRI